MASGHRGFVRKRTIWLFVIMVLFYVAIAARVAQVQVLRNAEYKAWAKRIRYREITIPAVRGSIYDRTGRALAVSIQTASIYANRNEVKDRSRTASQVAALTGLEENALQKKFNSKESIVWLGKKLDPRLAERVEKKRAELPGVGIQRDTKRVYPSGTLAAHILGFTNFNNKGLEGLECTFNDTLTGAEGSYMAELDAERRVIPETRRVIREPEQGKDVYLTIDIGIQHIAEQALDRMAEVYRPENACAIVMDPHTGEILALANYPTFNPNEPMSVPASVWRNRAVADLYEPGSTLKAVTVAAALNEGISQYAVVAQCTGREVINGGRIRCSLHHPFMDGHGGVDMYKMIQQSCNIGCAHLAFRMGAEKLYSYEKAFGLLDKVRAGFGCEATGYTAPVSQWRPMRLANIGFGQGIATSSLQMTSVYATIANGGVYVEPQIIREIRNADGTVERPFKTKVVRRVISKKAAFTTAKMLKECVLVGTGKSAKIPGRTVAGKTGSAQIAKPRGGYESGAFVSSFIGFAPVTSPRLVIAVIVTRPQGSHWGATVAAPVFREIGEKALWYLRVPSDAPDEKDTQKREGDNQSLV